MIGSGLGAILTGRRGDVVALALAALVALGGCALAPDRTWADLLLVSYGLVTVGLAGVLGLALQYANRGPDKVALRRAPEAMSRLLPVGAVGIVAVLLVHPSLYPWTAGLAPGHAGGFKAVWLSRPFFLGRTAVYLALWLTFRAALIRASRRAEHDPGRAYGPLSALFFYVFAGTLQLACYDWVMSLEPAWYSTIFGFYHFAGLGVSGLAVAVLLLAAGQRREPHRRVARPEQLYDLGQLLLTMCCLWVYLWFSQYLLIWYVNIPEETVYFVHRTAGAWGPLFYLNPLVNWLLPFLVLLPREAKRSVTVLSRVAVLLLFGRWLDLHLMVLPAVVGAGPVVGLLDGVLALGGLILGRLVLSAPSPE